jgi:predicted secreted protein
MKKILVLTIATLALVVGATACGNDNDAADSNAKERDVNKTLGFRDSSLPIAVVPGQTFAIDLPTTGGTGYEWSITSEPDPAVAAIVDPEGAVTNDDADNRSVGTPESTRFEFKAVASGSTTVTFTSARSSDPDDDPTTTTFTINVS